MSLTDTSIVFSPQDTICPRGPVGRNGNTALFLAVSGIFRRYSVMEAPTEATTALGVVPTEGTHTILAREQDDCYLQNLSSVL